MKTYTDLDGGGRKMFLDGCLEIGAANSPICPSSLEKNEKSGIKNSIFVLFSG